MIKDIFKSMGTYRIAIQYMFKRKLWHWQIVPGFVSLLLGALIFGAAYLFGDNLGGILSNWYPWTFGAAFVAKFFGIIGKILIVVSGLFLYRYVLLIIISPFLSLLSEKVEKIYRNDPHFNPPLFSLKRMFRDIRRGIFLALRNLSREIFYILLLLLVGLIPGLGLLTTPLTFAVQSYYAGFANMDFTNERYKNTQERIQFVKNHRGLAIGNGLVFLGLLFIPIIGLFLAPTLGVIAATIDVLDEEEMSIA